MEGNATNVMKNKQDDEEPDYAEPLDSICNTKTKSTNVAITKKSSNSNENIKQTSILSCKKQRYSDSNLQYEYSRKSEDIDIQAKKSIAVKKQSLPIFFRKFSEKTETVLLANEQKLLKQERRISALMDNLLAQNKKSKRVSIGSYQIDSSSWEFLNKEQEETSTEEAPVESDSESDSESSNKDSLYQSEFDSTSTIETKSNSLPKKDQDNSVFSVPEFLTYCDEVSMPRVSPSQVKRNTEIADCVQDLVSGGDTFLSKSVRQFIACTEESRQPDPRIVMRNIRQFITGIKNYLVRTGEEDLYKMIEKKREELKPNSFIDIDSILEDALQEVIFKPLHEKVLQLLKATVKSSECCDNVKSSDLSEELQI